MLRLVERNLKQASMIAAVAIIVYAESISSCIGVQAAKALI